MSTTNTREFNFAEVNSILINVYLNKNSIEAQVNRILEHNLVFENKNYQQWLLRAVSVLDLTTLSGDDTRSNVRRLCAKADRPLPELNIDIKTAAVCVYPSRVSDASDTINRMQKQDVKIASVATGFPSGLYDIETRTLEIKYAVSCGAHEIDVVIDRSLVLTGQWLKLFNELRQMKEACKDAHMKVILGVGELGSYENVYRASIVSILAGANFIKTSTGKEAVNATLPVGLVMCRAIKRCYQDYNIKVGLKPAGGIKTARDAVNWLILVQSELGPEWVTPEYFRIGASSLLDEIKKELKLVSTLPAVLN